MSSMIEIAKRAEQRINEIVKSGGHVIDMGDDVKIDGLTGYMARQVDGEYVSAETDIEGVIEDAMRIIQNRFPASDAVEAYDYLYAFEGELHERGILVEE